MTNDFLAWTINSVVNNVWRRFRHYVDIEDLRSEAWLWAYEHPKRLADYLDDEDQRRGRYRLRRDIMMKLDVYARGQKSHTLGYEREDEYFYSLAQIKALLPMAVYGPESRSAGTESLRGTTDPAEGGNLATALLDVREAWKRAALTKEERDLVVAYVIEEVSQSELGARLGVDQRTIGRRVDKILRRVVDALGGVRPTGCPYDCECHESPLRLRPGVRR